MIIVACSNEEAIVGGSSEDGLDSVNNKAVTLSGATMDDVSVLIFGFDNADFKYQRAINTGWSADGKVSTLLEIGTYKFLFLKNAGANTNFNPNPLNANSDFEDIRIDAKNDPSNAGYLLPVDEIWLPETESMADEIYVIKDSTTIHNKLKRAVSQVQLTIKRAYNDSGTIKPLPFPTGVDIMANIKEIKIDINGVGQSIDIAGGIGAGKTLYLAQSADSITSDGYAIFDGPFVFPNGSGTNSSVDITIVPKDNNPFPVMSKEVQGLLERNKKLEITLWLTSTYKFINITVKIEPISESEDGDTGIWE